MADYFHSEMTEQPGVGTCYGWTRLLLTDPNDVQGAAEEEIAIVVPLRMAHTSRHEQACESHPDVARLAALGMGCSSNWLS